MASFIYNSAFRDIMNGALDLDTDTIKCMLMTSSYSPNKDHDKRDDITNEVSGTGYTAGGATLASKAVTADNTDDEGVFDADDVSWPSSTITARYAALYKSRGGASSADELLALIDFGADKISTNGTFLIQWDAEGIINLASA